MAHACPGPRAHGMRCVWSRGMGALWRFRLLRISRSQRPWFSWPLKGALLWGSPGQGLEAVGVGGAGAQAALLQMGYLKKNGDGSLLYSVVNTAGLDADGACPPPPCPVC